MVWDFLKKPYNITFEELIRECIDSWKNTCVEDVNNYYSEENLEEMVLENGYEFYENGKRY